MNYNLIYELLDVRGYQVEYMSMTYSTDLISAVNIGLKRGKETLSFNLQCPSLEDLAGEAQSLAEFIDGLAKFMTGKGDEK